MIDILIEKIAALNNPTAVGLDTSFDYLPENVQAKCKTLADAGKAITDYNFELIEKLYKYIPCVKVQVAYYEMYGVEGMLAFENTLKMAKARNLVVIADVKRNDIGSTAGCYSKAYLSGVKIGGQMQIGFESDFITVNGYLGGDGITPFVEDCQKFNKGLFVLVKTSNPSSGELQDKIFKDGDTLYQSMGRLVNEWGKSTIGKYGFNDVGAVVGATHPRQAEILREQMPNTFFLIPGYGAQGGSAADLKVFFNKNNLGGIVNNSRGIICAYKNEKYRGQTFSEAALNATIDMQQDLSKYLGRAII